MNTERTKVKRIGLIENLFSLRSFVRNPAVYLQKILSKNHGLAEVKILMRLVTVTDRPEMIRHVLQQNNRNYKKTKVVRSLIKEQVGNGLLTSDGPYWLKQRRAIQPGFHKQRLNGISKIMVNEIQEYMDDTLEKHAESQQAFDITKEMGRLAFRIVAKSLLGNSANVEELELVDEIVSKNQQFIVDQVRRPFLKPWFHLTGKYKQMRELKQKGDNLILRVIRERKESGEKHDDLLDMLLETRYEDGTSMTDQQLLDELIILYVAGHETTAMAMSWAWYLLVKHPEIEEKLVQSGLDVLGDNAPSFEKTRELSYSLQVVEETMRMYPPAWLVDREPLEDDEFEGYKIRKGQDVVCLMYSLHHNPKYWKNPEKFVPDRFSEANKKERVPFSYIPFGGGPRLCIGNSFALMEMQFILLLISKKYKFELLPNQEIDLYPMVTLRPRHGIQMKVSKK